MAVIEERNNYKFDILICCGDYQAVRNYGDLKHMHVREKFRHLNTFYRYYSGELEAPILTLFVGGNHEASGFLQELPNGGWVAPNIYYLGHASVVRFAGLRIAGLSGIYKKHHYNLAHYECPVFHNYDEIVSIYHVRSIDVFRLTQLRCRDDSAIDHQFDIIVSHDWPAGIVRYGDKKKLLRMKPYFEDDINNDILGNSASMSLLYAVQPRYWFAAHLHCKFAALVPHGGDKGKVESTRFLALDKPIRGRQFLQVLEIDVCADKELTLEYDSAWLAILKSTDNFTLISRNQVYMPSRLSNDERCDFRPTMDELVEVERIFEGNFTIPRNFRCTAPPHRDNENADREAEVYYRNPQSTEFCEKLGISNLNELLCNLSTTQLGNPHYLLSEGSLDSSEISGNEKEVFEVEDFGSFTIDRNPS